MHLAYNVSHLYLMANFDEQGDCTRGLVSCLLGAGLLLNGCAIYCHILNPTLPAHHSKNGNLSLLLEQDRLIEAVMQNMLICSHR